MLAEIIGLANLAVVLFLGLYIIKDRTEINIGLWAHGLRLDDLEKRVTELEKKRD